MDTRFVGISVACARQFAPAISEAAAFIKSVVWSDWVPPDGPGLEGDANNYSGWAVSVHKQVEYGKRSSRRGGFGLNALAQIRAEASRCPDLAISSRKSLAPREKDRREAKESMVRPAAARLHVVDAVAG